MRLRGVVKFFNQTRGFGFIKPDNGEKDVFVHITTIQRGGIPSLHEGMKLSFDIETDKSGRGMQAVELQLI